MTIKYELTKAINRDELDRIKPCIYYNHGCHILKLDNDVHYIVTNLPEHKYGFYVCKDHEARYRKELQEYQSKVIGGIELKL